MRDIKKIGIGSTVVFLGITVFSLVPRDWKYCVFVPFCLAGGFLAAMLSDLW